MNYWVDTHAHLYLPEFDADRDEVVERARAGNVGKIFMPNIDEGSIEKMLAAEAKYPGWCLPMMGLHPCSVKKDVERQLYKVEDWLSRRTFAAVGEVGTDLYWDKTFWEEQKTAFRIQASLAKQHNLPLVIHCRQTLDETIDMIEDLQDGSLRGVFHCFSGDSTQAYRIIKAGFYLGIGGVATFKNGGLDSLLPQLSLNNLVLETDSPYLAPVPYRGKRNEPSYIVPIAEKVAALMKQPLDAVMTCTTQNALTLFRYGT